MNFQIREVNGMTNLALAHVGDGVYELLVRTYLCTRGDKTAGQLHKNTVELVKATTQAGKMEKILPKLTPQEQDFYRRGKNTHTHGAPKSASPQEYAKATGLECLFGALYLMGRTERLGELFDLMMEDDHGL